MRQPDMLDIDQEKFQALTDRFVGELAAVMHADTALVGDRLGLCAAMGDWSR